VVGSSEHSDEPLGCGTMVLVISNNTLNTMYSCKVHILFKSFLLCGSAYITGLDGHLLPIRIYYCKAYHSTDIILHSVRS
jgi:hypothetical protein